MSITPVDAIELLLCKMVHLPWVDSLDWQQWQASAKALTSQHSSIARESLLTTSRADKDRTTMLQSQLAWHLTRKDAG